MGDMGRPRLSFETRNSRRRREWLQTKLKTRRGVVCHTQLVGPIAHTMARLSTWVSLALIVVAIVADEESRLRGLERPYRQDRRHLGLQHNIFSKQSMMMMKGKTGMMMKTKSMKAPKPRPARKPVPWRTPKPVPTPSGVQPDQKIPTNSNVNVIGGQVYLKRPRPTTIQSDPVRAPTTAPSDAIMPSPSPTSAPTSTPSDTVQPSPSPSSQPTAFDGDLVPTSSPTDTPVPSPSPSRVPTTSPSGQPTEVVGSTAGPTETLIPSPSPSSSPTFADAPTSTPTETTAPSPSPSATPTFRLDADVCDSVACPPGQSCDLLDGTCRSNNALRPCIAVIDESSQGDAFINTTWVTFRSQFPERSFCLLQPQIPNTGDDRLFRPPDFETDVRTTFSLVSRDNGNATLTSDWADICGIGVLAVTGIDYVALFVDTSGSMSLSTVKASYDQFLEDLNATQLTFRSVENPNEDWITPFLVNLT